MKHMKTRILLISIVVILTFVTALSAESPPVMPKIWVASALHNYGDVLKGEKILHAFVIKNQGKADLIIEKAEPD